MTAEEWAEKVIKVNSSEKTALAWGHNSELVIWMAGKLEADFKAFMADVFRQVQEDAVRQFAEKLTEGKTNDLPSGIYHAKGDDWGPLCGGSEDEGISSASKYVNCKACLNLMATNAYPAKPIEHNGV